MLSIRINGPKGKSVFAEKQYHSGDLIEKSPIIVIPASQWPYIEKTEIFNYCYDWADNNSAVGLGYVSLYNHSYHPNAAYKKNFHDQLIEIYAINDIKPDEEITVNYNGNPEDQGEMWFKVVE